MPGPSDGGGGGSAGGGTTTAGGSAAGGSAGGSTSGGTVAGGSAGGGNAGGGSAGGSAGGAAGGTVTPTAQAITGLSAGENSTCAVLANKSIKCWGRNNSGQLGNGTTVDSIPPVAVSGITTASSVSVGYEHACARLEDGTARCWGSNSIGQLGNNSTTTSNVPVTVMGLANVASIHAGVYTTCARLMDNTVWCWGRGGDLGNGIGANSPVPVQVSGLANVIQLSVSHNSGTAFPNHACGVRMNGTAFCWGLNADGQIGDGTQNDARRPVDVMGITDALEITAGGSHACARRTSGLYCWGTAPEIGDGTVNRKFVPTAVATAPNVTAIMAGNRHTLARTAANGLLCWGYSGSGQCGDGTAFPPGGPIYSTPISALLTNVSLFTSGGNHSCAYVPTTQVTWCWGAANFDQLGFDPMETRTSTPGFVRW